MEKKKAYMSNRGVSGGFTLIESLVYIALLVILFTGIVQAVAMLSSSYRSVRTVRSVESSATQAIDRMAREIRNSTEVNAGQTVFNNNPGSLSLIATTGDDSPTVRFFVSGGRLMLEENGVNLGPITAADVVVTSLVFRSFATTTSAAVKIELNLTSASTSLYQVNEKFYTTAVLRGSY